MAIVNGSCSYSRPSVSNDNPFSESCFKTLKYSVIFPEKGFDTLEEWQEWVYGFQNWYNNIHYHSGIRWTTPNSRHEGRDKEILLKRHEIYQEKRKLHPERWSKNTRNWTPIGEVKLNPSQNPKAKE